jgi:hypothetical protein
MALAASQTVIAQNTSELDRRNGFKDVHLGDQYSKWANELTLPGSTDFGMLGYEFKQECLWRYDVFETPVQSVTLYFSDNSLKEISVKTEYFQHLGGELLPSGEIRMEEIQPTLDKLSGLFGKPWDITRPANKEQQKFNGLISYAWAGQKVLLKMCYENKAVGKSYLVINIYDMPFLMYNNGF